MSLNVPDNSDTRPSGAFLLRYFGAAFLVSVAAALLYFDYSGRLHRRLADVYRDNSKMQSGFGRIILLDETLTMSARLAAAGGGPEYGRRYDRAAAELDQAIKETAALLPEPDEKAFLAEMDKANDRLVEMERAAFALAGRGRRTEARALLDSGAYLKWKKAYAADVEKLSRAAEAGLGAEGAKARELFRFEVLAGAGVLAVMVFSWLMSVMTLRRRSLESGQSALLLREKEDDYRRFFNNVNEIFYCTDLRGIIKKVTPSVYRLAGYRPEEVLGRPAQEIYENPADRAALIKEMLSKGSVTNYVVRLKTRRRGVLYAAVNASLTRGFAGLPVGVEGSLRDITGMKLAEEALKQRTDQMEALIQNSPAAIIPVDREGKVLMWNKAAERIFGWSAAETVGNPNPLVPGNKKNEFDSILTGLFSGTPVVDLETQRLRKDGSLVEVSLSGIPMRGKSGEIESAMAFITDITARKRLERSLRERQRVLTTLLGNLPGTAYRCRNDAGRTMEYLSEGCAGLTGYPHAHFIGEAGAGYGGIILAQDRDEVKKKVDESLAEKKPFELTYRINTADGRIKWVWEKGRGIYSETGELEALEGFITDITARKAAEEQLDQARDLLRQGQRIEAVGRLAGGVAHDFNNIITAILAYAGLVGESLAQGDPRRADVDEIRTAAERAAALTRQLLAFSRRQVLLPTMMNLNATVRGMEGMLKRLIGEQVELSLNLAGDLASVKADPGQMEQVIMNLAVNARDALPEGGRLIIETANVTLDESALSRHDVIPPGAYVRLTISDNGAGMDQATIAHIFEPFFTTKEMGKGTGLGLSTVYGIVKQSNGYIWVYSEPGGGSSFRIYFPAAAGTPAAKPAASAPAHEKGSGTIILAEDEDQVRTVLARILRGSGYTVIEAVNGEDVLNLGEEKLRQAGLLLTDLVMPKLGGRQLAARVKAVSPGIKVIYMSGYSEVLAKAEENIEYEGVFLQKPVAAETLLCKVREALGGPGLLREHLT